MQEFDDFVYLFLKNRDLIDILRECFFVKKEQKVSRCNYFLSFLGRYFSKEPKLIRSVC
jgi:hypothetical protein